MSMAAPICVVTCDTPPWNRREILRYAGVGDRNAGFDEGLERCIAEIEDQLIYRVCYREFPIVMDQGSVDLGFLKTDSRDLAKNLCGCERILLFAATVGLAPDRMVSRYASLSPTKALWMQAIGAERIESLCECFAAAVREQKREEGLLTRPRFSPGYGDFSIEAQRDIFAVLDCQRKLGLALNESLLMSPTKSVTAIIGLTRDARESFLGDGCDVCQTKECIYRRNQ